MANHQIEIIQESFPEEFYSNPKDLENLQLLIVDLEKEEKHNHELAKYLQGDLLTALANELIISCQGYDKIGFWSGVHNSATREDNPLSRFIARWRERSWRGTSSDFESNDESYARQWQDYKDELPTRESNTLPPKNILKIIENWADFPFDELYLMAKEFSRDFELFTRSKRLSVIVTLNPEPLRKILKNYPEGLHRLTIPRLFSKEAYLDPATIINGDEDFTDLVLRNPGPLPQITLPKLFAAVGTPKALTFAQTCLRELNDTPFQTSGSNSGPSTQTSTVLQLSTLSEDRPWLAEFLASEQDIFAYALRFVTEKPWLGNADFWFPLIQCKTLLPQAMVIYACDPSCTDRLWRSTLVRLCPDENVVILTAKIADECVDALPQKIKDQIIQAQLKFELASFLDSAKLETAEEIVRFALTAIPQFFKDVGIELTPSGIRGTAKLQQSPQGYIFLWTWLDDKLMDGQKSHDVKGNVAFLHKQLQSFHDAQDEQPQAQLFSALHESDRCNNYGSLKERYIQRLVYLDRDPSLVEQLFLAAKERILRKIQKFIPDSAQNIIEQLEDDYPSRPKLENLLTKHLGWPAATEGNDTFKLLDRLDDDTLPELLRESLKTLVHSEQDLWHHYSYLATFLREVYPEYPQAWVRAIVPLLDKGKYINLDPEWTKALSICLGFLREPWGNKVPQLLRTMAGDASLGTICEDIKEQASLFNRENFNKGHHRLERRRVDDVKRYLSRTSRLVGNKHKSRHH